MKRRTSDSEEPPIRRKPATTAEGRESQLISMALDLVEDRLRKGTASAQEVTHLLKLGSSREQLEQQRIAHENELMRVKIQAAERDKEIEELYRGAINAMRSYTGQDVPGGNDDYDQNVF